MKCTQNECPQTQSYSVNCCCISLIGSKFLYEIVMQPCGFYTYMCTTKKEGFEKKTTPKYGDIINKNLRLYMEEGSVVLKCFRYLIKFSTSGRYFRDALSDVH